MVGVVGTAAHYLTLILLVESLGFGAVPATTAGFVVGLVVNYWLNYRYTFASNRPHRAAMPRFMCIGVITGFLNTVLVFFGTETLRIHYLPVQFVATGAVFVLNYVLNSAWTFADRGKAS